MQNVYNSMVFSILIQLCQNRHYPHPSAVTVPPQQQLVFLSPWICLLWTFPVSGIIQCETCIWLLSLSTKFPKLTHVAAWISTSCLFRAEQHSPLWIDLILFIHSSVDGHLGWLYFLAIMNKATMDIHVQVFMWR